MTRRLLPLVLTLLALAAVLAAPAGAANPLPPAATSGTPTDITLTGATLTATVDPQGAATTYHFDYGTSDSYGLVTTDRDAGSGTGPVTVSVPVTGLTSDTTYHVRIVATNAAGVTRGSDKTFKTLTPAKAPVVTTGSARSIKANTATLTGSLDPLGQKTTYHYEYGTSTRYGASTPDATAEGTGSRTVSSAIGGLVAYTTYHYRLVATNATGTVRGRDRTLRTLRAPTAVTFTAGANPVSWGDKVTLTGKVLGTGVGGTSVAVQRSDFPFMRGFWIPRTFSAKSDGSFSTSIGPLWETTRLQLVTRSTNVATSPVVTIGVRVRVGVRRQAAGRRAVVLSGVVRPAIPQGRVSVQRRTVAGAWVPVARAGFSALPGNRSRYRIRVPRARRTAEVRVVALPNDGGGHDIGYSRTLTVRGRR
jgi:hypothetical protein